MNLIADAKRNMGDMDDLVKELDAATGPNVDVENAEEVAEALDTLNEIAERLVAEWDHYSRASFETMIDKAEEAE